VKVIQKKKSLPATRGSRLGGWLALDYLCKKVRFWLYVRNDKSGAARYRERLEKVLQGLPENDDAIIRHDGLALLSELNGDPGAAIVHRRREIALMERLHRDAQSPSYSDNTRAFMLQNRGRAELQDRRAILRRLESAYPQGNGDSKPR
jgi:hypothetical protein